MNLAAPDAIALALAEDVGAGDVTTNYFVAAGTQARAEVVARQKAIVAGLATGAEVFRRVDPKLRVAILCADGAAVEPGATLLEIGGSARSILTAERVALNFLQRLSGIATLTRQFVEAIGAFHARILDTRKTTPGLRALEKAAVAAGGGTNHRIGLFDMVMVKDNHLASCSDFAKLKSAVERVHAEHPGMRIELEADNLEQVRTFLKLEGVDVILLDNMKPARMREAVAMGKGKVQFEASGGVTLRNVRQIAATGVNYISVGALTHSAPAADFSLELTFVPA